MDQSFHFTTRRLPICCGPVLVNLCDHSLGFLFLRGAVPGGLFHIQQRVLTASLSALSRSCVFGWGHICIFAIPSSWMGVPNKVASIVCDRKFCPKDLVSQTEAANKQNEGALKWQVKTSESIHCIIQELVDPHTDQLRLLISSGRCWLEKSFWCEEMVASSDYVNKLLRVKTINHLLHSF